MAAAGTLRTGFSAWFDISASEGFDFDASDAENRVEPDYSPPMRKCELSSAGPV